ncbi:MAG: hypothetical protein AB3N23_11430 [Paracoccaceae bacterium]
MTIKTVLSFIAACCFGAVVFAETAPKFEIVGDTLHYDTERPDGAPDAEIDDEDLDTLRTLLRDNRGITTLEINSAGGDVYAAYEIARVVTDFGLDTVVAKECSSACVTVFLAGDGRRMRLGASIGFHQTSWSAASIERYFERNRERRGWATPFEFTSWVYRDTQTEVHSVLEYMVDRGVDPLFAIETIGVENTDMWFPSRLRLMAAGVLRDPQAASVPTE